MNAPTKLALILSAVAIALPQPAIGKSGGLSKLWAGNWHLNAAQSNFSSPDTSVKSERRSYTVSGNRVTMRADTVMGSGKRMKWDYSAATNGRWYAMHGNPNADQIALTWVSDLEVKSQSRLHGKPSARSDATVSADGKVLTIKRSILTAKGGPSDDTLVYDRAK